MTTHAFPGPQAPSWRCTRCGCLPGDKLAAFPCMPTFGALDQMAAEMPPPPKPKDDA